MSFAKETVTPVKTQEAELRSVAWLFPVTYLLHIAEEYFAGFPAHLLLTRDVSLSTQRFLLLQSIGLILMIIGIVVSRKLKFPNQMLAILATLVIANSLVHLVRTLLFGAYEPGLLTALLLWLPLGIATLVHLRSRMPGLRFVVSATIGVAICAAVELITLSKI